MRRARRGLKSNWERWWVSVYLGWGCGGEPQSTGGVGMRMGGVREEVLPVWWEERVKGLSLDS